MKNLFKNINNVIYIKVRLTLTLFSENNKNVTKEDIFCNHYIIKNKFF